MLTLTAAPAPGKRAKHEPSSTAVAMAPRTPPGAPPRELCLWYSYVFAGYSFWEWCAQKRAFEERPEQAWVRDTGQIASYLPGYGRRPYTTAGGGGCSFFHSQGGSAASGAFDDPGGEVVLLGVDDVPTGFFECHVAGGVLPCVFYFYGATELGWRFLLLVTEESAEPFDFLVGEEHFV